MLRTVKHLSLHRVAGTELRVVADVGEGVLPVIQVEEAVIRRYACTGGSESRPYWPHRWVTLFVLQDLQPLIRQLTPAPALLGGGSEGGGQLLPGGAAGLDSRPLVNVYDLADLARCHVFVNRHAMLMGEYWDDLLAVQGLLAHEHAHPLAENATTRASRELRLELWLEGEPFADCRQTTGALAAIRRRRGAVAKQATEGQEWLGHGQDRIRDLLSGLASNLSLYAPREVFANEVAIRSDFGEALLHLDRRNVAHAGRSVGGREELRQQLQEQVSRGELTPASVRLLLLIGDLEAYLELALEVASFYRTGQERAARELEGVLQRAIFPYLEPEVPRSYIALRERYVALRPELTPAEFIAWGEGVLDILSEALSDKEVVLGYRLQTVDD